MTIETVLHCVEDFEDYLKIEVDNEGTQLVFKCFFDDVFAGSVYLEKDLVEELAEALIKFFDEVPDE